MTRLQAMRAKQDPQRAALRTDGARLIYDAVVARYQAADRATGAERRRLLREAALATQAMRKAEGEARA